MALGVTLQDSLLGWFRGQAFLSPPAEMYLSFHSSGNVDAGTDISASMGGRVQVLPGDWSAPRTYGSGREIVNQRAFITGIATATLVIPTFGIWSSPSGGTLWLKGDVIPDATVNEGDPGVFLAGDLAIRLLGA